LLGSGTREVACLRRMSDVTHHESVALRGHVRDEFPARGISAGRTRGHPEGLSLLAVKALSHSYECKKKGRKTA
jgi:hypothetical protein